MTSKSIRNILLISAAVAVFFITLYLKQIKTPISGVVKNNVSPTLSLTETQVLGSDIRIRTKTSGCQVKGNLPDPACSPGDILKEATVDQICVPGYAKNIRNVSEKTKNEFFAEYGITSHLAGEYEVDHLVSLEIGGSNDIANLWPEAAEPHPGFHEKDQVENYLHLQVCRGLMKLDQAQKIISGDWTQMLGSVTK